MMRARARRLGARPARPGRRPRRCGSRRTDAERTGLRDSLGWPPGGPWRHHERPGRPREWPGGRPRRSRQRLWSGMKLSPEAGRLSTPARPPGPRAVRAPCHPLRILRSALVRTDGWSGTAEEDVRRRQRGRERHWRPVRRPVMSRWKAAGVLMVPNWGWRETSLRGALNRRTMDAMGGIWLTTAR
jgi:hypothetical protein